MRTLQPAVRLLSGLAERVRMQGCDANGADRPALTPVIDVVVNIGEALHDPDIDELHRVLPALAVMREALENGGGIEQSPWDALVHDKAEPFAAGSLWATSTIVNAVLDAQANTKRKANARATRNDVRQAVLRLVERKSIVGHADVEQHLAATGVTAAQTTVSKALGDLLDDGVLRPAADPPPGDRRQRWFERVPH